MKIKNINISSLNINEFANEAKITTKEMYFFLKNLNSSYKSFKIRKRGGHRDEFRAIYAPKDDLKYLQKRILKNFLSKFSVHKNCYGFVKNKSILDNVKPHVGKKKILKLDLKDFFPSISLKNVRDCAYYTLGLDKMSADWFSKLVTYNGVLPQGAPTSPYISNLITRGLDVRLSGLAKKLKLDYTRYADDITFSGDVIKKSVYSAIIRIIKDEGFSVLKRKTRFLSSKNRQIVTGLVINDTPNVPRKERRRLRAILHKCDLFGVSSQARGNPYFQEYIRGKIEFVKLSNDEAAKKLYTKYNLLDWHNYSPIKTLQVQTDKTLVLLRKISDLNYLVGTDHNQNIRFEYIISLLSECKTKKNFDSHCILLNKIQNEILQSFSKNYLSSKVRDSSNIIESFLKSRNIDYNLWNEPIKDIRDISNRARHSLSPNIQKILKKYSKRYPQIDYTEVWISILDDIIKSIQILFKQCKKIE